LGQSIARRGWIEVSGAIGGPVPLVRTEIASAIVAMSRRGRGTAAVIVASAFEMAWPEGVTAAPRGEMVPMRVRPAIGKMREGVRMAAVPMRKFRRAAMLMTEPGAVPPRGPGSMASTVGERMRVVAMASVVGESRSVIVASAVIRPGWSVTVFP
jgi:hypothetical protein